MTAADRAAVLAHTREVEAPLCPELRLRLITPDRPLWRGDERAARTAGVPDPFWGFAWPGGQALARLVLDTPCWVAGRTVLDFGAGCGIGAIAAARAGARSVLAADVDPRAAAAVAINADLNGVAPRVTTDDLVGAPGRWDVVLAGDMYYDDDESARSGAWLRSLAAAGADVLVGDPGRGFLRADGARLLARLDALADNDADGTHTVRTAVYRLAGPRSSSPDRNR